jgi:hypothetical protein
VLAVVRYWLGAVVIWRQGAVAHWLRAVLGCWLGAAAGKATFMLMHVATTVMVFHPALLISVPAVSVWLHVCNLLTPACVLLLLLFPSGIRLHQPRSVQPSSH